MEKKVRKFLNRLLKRRVEQVNNNAIKISAHAKDISIAPIFLLEEMPTNTFKIEEDKYCYGIWQNIQGYYYLAGKFVKGSDFYHSPRIMPLSDVGFGREYYRSREAAELAKEQKISNRIDQLKEQLK